MNARILLTRASFAMLFLLGSVNQVSADIIIRLSVKYILTPGGMRPATGDIGTSAGFDAEVTRDNSILAATGRGYRMQVVEYIDIQPPVPAGESALYWYDLNARANRAVFESAALADQETWQWNPNTINIFVNNSSSGQCSFVGDGLSISLGNDIASGTVVHELGHYFNLKHTHAGAKDGVVDNWSDGDDLPETLPDEPDATRANLNARYPSETQQMRDDLWFNVMSYHQENRLLPVQMDIWTRHANGARLFACSGRTWHVTISGGCAEPDGNPDCTFVAAVGWLGGPFSSVASGVNAADSSGGDIVMISPGSYNEQFTITKRVTLRAMRQGAATIGH